MPIMVRAFPLHRPFDDPLESAAAGRYPVAPSLRHYAGAADHCAPRMGTQKCSGTGI